MTSYYVRLVAGPDTDSPLFTKVTPFAGHIPSIGEQLVVRHGASPEVVHETATVIDVTWRADFSLLEVTVEVDAEEWDVQRLVNDGSWRVGRTAKPKPKGDPRIDEDEDEDDDED
ncbi:hypothetical protein [Clavibacter capsici]|uniref:hypothetical protein n=1 Tax=Clavibacter capsici TaxID=1874630 RepID=UPI00293F1A4B|nr:hypothetical protein [Clavibacter capsici]